jgi:hypothetical protein
MAKSVKSRLEPVVNSHDLPKVIVYDGLTFVRDERSGYYRNNETRKRLHQRVYETQVGPIPKGMVIHHKHENDEHTLDASRLELMSRSDHTRLHMSDPERRAWARQNYITRAQPATKRWHASEEGRAWHSRHGAQTWVGREKTQVLCQWCGKPHLTPFPTRAKFCSGRCSQRGLWERRNAGQAPEGKKLIQVTCIVCRRSFDTTTNSRAKYCGARCSKEAGRMKRSGIACDALEA